MRTAADRFAPPPDVDEGWRDLIASAPPPPPIIPPDPSIRMSVPAGVTTDRHGCVTRVQFGGDIIVAPEEPSFDAADQRLWKVAGALMGLATLVLLLLGVLTFGSEPSVTASVAAPSPPPAKAATTHAPPTELGPPEAPSVGSARPLIAQHALRHSNTKHARKHKKIAER